VSTCPSCLEAAEVTAWERQPVTPRKRGAKQRVTLSTKSAFEGIGQDRGSPPPDFDTTESCLFHGAPEEEAFGLDSNVLAPATTYTVGGDNLDACWCVGSGNRFVGSEAEAESMAGEVGPITTHAIVVRAAEDWDSPLKPDAFEPLVGEHSDGAADTASTAVAATPAHDDAEDTLALRHDVQELPAVQPPPILQTSPSPSRVSSWSLASEHPFAHSTCTVTARSSTFLESSTGTGTTNGVHAMHGAASAKGAASSSLRASGGGLLLPSSSGGLPPKSGEGCPGQPSGESFAGFQEVGTLEEVEADSL